tara:strand:+ start:2033 stop:2809 length:777 start_codon:yes stop_codon:yes gene_type:complete
MGILNITKNSFYDGGKFYDQNSILNQCEKMIKEKVDIIDVGACSSKPGSVPVSEKIELTIIEKYTRIIKNKFPKIPISIDTFRSEVARVAIENGADIINDISAGNIDPKIIEVVAKNNIPYVLMHMQGLPINMQQSPKYYHVLNDLKKFFKKKIEYLNSMGIKKIIIDPGFGFGKSIKDNYSILNNLNEFINFGYPIITGISRKSMLTKFLNIKAEDSLNATTIANTIALSKGCNIIRVHDVKEAREIIRVLEYTKGL